MILENHSLKPFNTFGIDVNARYFSTFHTRAKLIELLQFASEKQQPLLILGGGSNVLFTQDFNGLVLKNNMLGYEIVKQKDEWVWLKIAAGENLHQMILFAIENNFAGAENLSLIPGCAGAAPMQNIGAYGIELKNIFEELEAVEIATGKVHVFDIAACKFGYRNSIFKNELKDKFVITSITLRFQNLNIAPDYSFKTNYGDIQKKLAEMQIKTLSLQAVSNAIISIREEKLPEPRVLGNAGSFYKNPVIDNSAFEKIKANYPQVPAYPIDENRVKIPAGWLIEQCGWKGKRVGNTGAHAHQALVIVNYGNASGKEIWKHAADIRESVMQKFGIDIEPEVNVY